MQKEKENRDHQESYHHLNEAIVTPKRMSIIPSKHSLSSDESKHELSNAGSKRENRHKKEEFEDLPADLVSG